MNKKRMERRARMATRSLSPDQLAKVTGGDSQPIASGSAVSVTWIPPTIAPWR